MKNKNQPNISKNTNLGTLVDQLNFWEVIRDMINKESSPLAKFLLQQNLIFFEITQVLQSLKLAINELILKGAIDKGIDKFEVIPRLKIPTPKELLEKETLGSLIGIFRKYAPPDAKTVVNLLEDYNTKRNNLVHKIFIKYTHKNGIISEASQMTKTGENILKELEKIDVELGNIWKD